MSTVWVVRDEYGASINMGESDVVIVGVASSQERARRMILDNLEKHDEILDKWDTYGLKEYVSYHFKDGSGSGLYIVVPFEVDQ
jgi:hypothetical protein